jgi:hypothetical protein
MAAHHPFTSPHEEDMPKLEAGVESLHDPQSELSAVRALAYDVVLNGTELGSGSIRIHRQDVQSRIFRALGMNEEEARARFGFFLEALEYGTPPHGGIALGLDRIVMILAGAESLREVIPFPKTARAVDLMVDAPSLVSRKQLRDLSIDVLRFGDILRKNWLEKLPRSIELRRVGGGGRTYVNAVSRKVGIPSAREVKANTWTLQLPREFDHLVLLCQTDIGNVLDFVLPGDFVAQVWPGYHPRRGHRIRARVVRASEGYYLKAGRQRFDITERLGKVEALSS